MKLAHLVVKKINGTISKEEERTFAKWFHQSEENQKIFLRLEKLEERGVDISEMVNLDSESAWGRVLDKYEARVKVKYRSSMLRPLLRYASIFVGVCAMGYSYFDYTSSKNMAPDMDANTITLQLDNGEVRVLSSDGEQEITDINGTVVGTKQDNKLDYKNTKAAVEKLIYNTLKIPNGKKFEITLSDGTIVHLNSGSSIRYPVKFLKEEERRVFLVGEAFFNVSSDKAHPFIVNTSEMDVTVTGTKFNVTAYPEDNYINTVLVEGSVSLSDTGQDDNERIQLEPGYKAEWDIDSGKTNMVKVDTDVYTSWILGRLVLKNMSFKNIVKKLERHYNVEINNNYMELNDQIFTASFDIETIDEVLGSFAENRAFTFETNGETIIINKP